MGTGIDRSLSYLIGGPDAAGKFDFTVAVTGFLCLTSFFAFSYSIISRALNAINEDDKYPRFMHQHCGPDDDNPVVGQKYVKPVRTFRSFFKELLPIEFRYITTTKLFRIKILEEHDLLSQRFLPDVKDCAAAAHTATRCYGLDDDHHRSPSYRVERWFRALCTLLNYLTVSVLLALFWLSNALDGSCKDRESRSNCEQTSSLGSVFQLVNLCHWNDDDRDGNGSCSDTSANPNSILRVVTTMGFAVTLLSALLGQGTRALVSHCRCAWRRGILDWLLLGICGGAASTHAQVYRHWRGGRTRMVPRIVALNLLLFAEVPYHHQSKDRPTFILQKWCPLRE